MAFLGSATRSRQKGFQKQKSFKDFFKTGNRKTIAIIIVIALASIGAYLLFFASAATNNCQVENNVQICDVDQTAGSADTVLSLYGEAESLANSGWGIYYGAAFRAPTSAYNGAVPVHRLNNGNASWHEWVTDAQKGQKEAAAGGAGNLVHEGVAFFAWTDASQPGTVPIYRITRGGTATQSIFTTDKAWVDKMLVGGEWKADETMPLIAFYAYPANYAVAETPNPYDCSIQVNYESDRCASQKQNLEKGVSQGVITASTECPKSWSDWNKNVNPGQFAKECQDIWNTYGKDCSNSEILATDRCKKEREALEAANKAAIKARDDVAKAAKAAKIASNVKAPSDRTASGSNTSASNSCPASVEAWNALGAAGQKQTAKDCQKFWNTVSGKICPSGQHKVNGECRANASNSTTPSASGNSSSNKQPRSITEIKDRTINSSERSSNGTCTITWKMEKYWGIFGSSNGIREFHDVTSAYCNERFEKYKEKYVDEAGRRHYEYKKTWKVN